MTIKLWGCCPNWYQRIKKSGYKYEHFGNKQSNKYYYNQLSQLWLEYFYLTWKFIVECNLIYKKILKLEFKNFFIKP